MFHKHPKSNSIMSYFVIVYLLFNSLFRSEFCRQTFSFSTVFLKLLLFTVLLRCIKSLKSAHSVSSQLKNKESLILSFFTSMSTLVFTIKHTSKRTVGDYISLQCYIYLCLHDMSNKYINACMGAFGLSLLMNPGLKTV